MADHEHAGRADVVSVEPEQALSPGAGASSPATARTGGRSSSATARRRPKRPAGDAAIVARVLWTTDGTPAPLDGEEDTAPAGLSHRWPRLRAARSCASRTSRPTAPTTTSTWAQLFREIGGARHQEAGDRERRRRGICWFHKTPTLDYAIVLDGEVWALLDEDETLMRTGDVLIQRGTNHAWANRSDQPCRMAFVLIDGQEGS